jgi:hypothetical protein
MENGTHFFACQMLEVDVSGIGIVYFVFTGIITNTGNVRFSWQ